MAYFARGLAEFGLFDGKNLLIDRRWPTVAYWG